MTVLHNLLTPIDIGMRKAKNRIASAAHNINWDRAGALDDPQVDYWVRKAAGGTGLVMCFGSANVHEAMGRLTGRISLWDRANEPYLKRLADDAHAYGALVISQASHMGRRGNSTNTGRPLQAPSALPEPMHREIPHVLQADEIRDIVDSFAAAAQRLQDCGWDGIEVTSYGGHLIEQFWSPVANTREDEYGGDIEGRMRFSVEVLTSVRAAVRRDFILAFRMSGDPATDAVGLSPDDMLEIAARLDSLGCIDLFNIAGSTGVTHEALAGTVPSDSYPTNCYLPLARRVKSVVTVPVLAAGRVVDVHEADAAVAAGDCDLVAMTRAIIADSDLAARAVAATPTRIRPCIGINDACIGRDLQGSTMICAVNPAIRHPWLEKAPPARAARHVVVVGAGPAGLEAARVAAERGHTVELFEAADRCGGQVSTAARARERPRLGRHVEWSLAELERLKVAVRVKSTLSVHEVLALDPDAVIVATGSVSVVPSQADGAHVTCTTDVEILDGRITVARGARVLVYDNDGRNRGGSIANLVAEEGAGYVELVTPLLAVCYDLDPTQQPALYRRFARNGVVCSPNQELRPATEGMIVLRDTWSNAQRRIEDADLAVFVGYRQASDDLYYQLVEARPGLQVRMAGDCLAPRMLYDAISEGAHAGAEL